MPDPLSSRNGADKIAYSTGSNFLQAVEADVKIEILADADAVAQKAAAMIAAEARDAVVSRDRRHAGAPVVPTCRFRSPPKEFVGHD